MKKLTAIITSMLISLPIVASADGGYQWEKWQNDKQITAQQLGKGDASTMGHTAVEHKRWVFDDPLPQPADTKKAPMITRTGAHSDHTAAEHKQVEVGGGR